MDLKKANNILKNVRLNNKISYEDVLKCSIVHKTWKDAKISKITCFIKVNNNVVDRDGYLEPS